MSTTIANTMNNVELLCGVIKQHVELFNNKEQQPPPPPPIVEEVAVVVEAAKKVRKPRKPILSAKYQKMMSIGVWFIQHLKEAELLSEDKMVEAYDMLKIFNSLEEQIAFYKEYDDKDMKKSVKKIANEKKKAEKLANKPVKVRKPRVVDPNKPKTPRKNKKTCEIVNNQDNIISQLVVSSSNDDNINIPLTFDVDDVMVDKIVGGEDLEQTFVGEDDETFIGDDTTIVDDEEDNNDDDNDDDDNMDNNTTFNTTYTYDDEDTIIYDDLDVEDDVPPAPTTPAPTTPAPKRTSTPILQERRKTVTFDVAPLSPAPTPIVVPVVPIVPIVAPIVTPAVVATPAVVVANTTNKTPAKPKQQKEPKTPKTPKAAVPKTPKTKTPKKVVEVVEVVVEEEVEQETLECEAYTYSNGLVVCLDKKTGKMYKEDGEEYSKEEIAEIKKMCRS